MNELQLAVLNKFDFLRDRGSRFIHRHGGVFVETFVDPATGEGFLEWSVNHLAALGPRRRDGTDPTDLLAGVQALCRSHVALSELGAGVHATAARESVTETIEHLTGAVVAEVVRRDAVRASSIKPKGASGVVEMSKPLASGSSAPNNQGSDVIANSRSALSKETVAVDSVEQNLVFDQQHSSRSHSRSNSDTSLHTKHADRLGNVEGKSGEPNGTSPAGAVPVDVAVPGDGRANVGKPSSVTLSALGPWAQLVPAVANITQMPAPSPNLGGIDDLGEWSRVLEK